MPRTARPCAPSGWDSRPAPKPRHRRQPNPQCQVQGQGASSGVSELRFLSQPYHCAEGGVQPAIGPFYCLLAILDHPSRRFRDLLPMMRTEQARPIRLEDSRPPDWLVETVELDVSLDPTATRVRATLALKPNPKAAAAAPLVLDGDGLNLVSLKL